MSEQAVAIVRRDHSGEQVDAHVRELGELAAERGIALRDGRVFVVDDVGDLAVLLARLPLDNVRAVLIPRLTHITGLLAVVRRECPVWTLTPRQCWPQRRPLSPDPRR